MPRSKTDDAPPPSAPSSLIIAALVTLGVVAALLSARAVVVATTTHGLLPRWDLAAHLVNGWTPYHHLVHGRVADFLWDLWSQGYWPPGQSLLQIPFYAAFGGGIGAGLHSSVAAFVVSGLCVVVLLGHVAGRQAWLPAAIALAFMCTSPFYLAYGTVAMSEMVGSMAQMLVLVAYARYERRPSAATTRWLSLALTLLFFVKYNYFVLLAVPLAGHVFLRATSGVSARARAACAWRPIAALLATWSGRAVAVYLAIVAVVLMAGGFSIAVGGRLVAFRTVGYALHPLLYAGLASLWLAHHRGRWSWARLGARDARWPPFLLWFVLPVTIWLASPYPNHIKDMAYLVVNVPMGQPSARLGLTAYLTSIRVDYFSHPAIAVLALAGVVAALVRYRTQPSLVRLLLMTAIVQVTLVSLHHTRDSRFMLLAMPPLWLAAAHEIGAWLARRRPAMATALGAIGLTGVAVAAERVTAGTTFEHAAFVHYVDSPALADAFASIRRAIRPGERLAVIGRSDRVSPGLVLWQLGPASGLGRAPDEVVRAADLPLLQAADRVLTIDPSETTMPMASQWVSDATRDRALVSSCEFTMTDLGLTLRLFRRHAPPASASASSAETVCD